MNEPMTDEELQSFCEYAGANMVEPDGSQCQWADYSVRCVDEIRRLHQERNEEVDEFNAGFEAYRNGMKDTDEPSGVKHDAWGIGFAWAAHEPAKAELAKLREENEWLKESQGAGWDSAIEHHEAETSMLKERHEKELAKLRKVVEAFSACVDAQEQKAHETTFARLFLAAKRALRETDED